MSSRRSIGKINGRPMLMQRAVFTAPQAAAAADESAATAPLSLGTPMQMGPPFELETSGNSSLVEKEMLKIREKLFKNQ